MKLLSLIVCLEIFVLASVKVLFFSSPQLYKVSRATTSSCTGLSYTNRALGALHWPVIQRARRVFASNRHSLPPSDLQDKKPFTAFVLKFLLSFVSCLQSSGKFILACCHPCCLQAEQHKSFQGSLPALVPCVFIVMQRPMQVRRAGS